MADKMREAFEKWATGEGLCVAPYGASYADEKTHTAWITWQAAQSVPVVGDVVAWRCKDYADGWILSYGKQAAEKHQEQTGCLMQELIVQPTHSISAAELERLRSKADAFDRLDELTTHEIAELAMRARNDFDGDLLAAIAAEGENKS